MGLSISFSNTGAPVVNNPALLQQLESQGAQGKQLQDAVTILQNLETDAFNGTQGQPISNIQFNLNGVQVNLPNPGHVLDNLSYELSGKNVTNAQLVQSVDGFLGTALTKLNSQSVTTEAQAAEAGLGSSNTQADDANQIDMNTLLNPTDSDLLSPQEMGMFNQMSKPDQQQYLMQKRMEWVTRLETLMTNLLKMKHDAMMSVIGNIRGN